MATTFNLVVHFTTLDGGNLAPVEWTVVYPIISQGFFTSQVVGFGISSRRDFWFPRQLRGCQLQRKVVAILEVLLEVDWLKVECGKSMGTYGNLWEPMGNLWLDLGYVPDMHLPLVLDQIWSDMPAVQVVAVECFALEMCKIPQRRG